MHNYQYYWLNYNISRSSCAVTEVWLYCILHCAMTCVFQTVIRLQPICRFLAFPTRS